MSYENELSTQMQCSNMRLELCSHASPVVFHTIYLRVLFSALRICWMHQETDELPQAFQSDLYMTSEKAVWNFIN